MSSSSVNSVVSQKSNWPLLNKANPFAETKLIKKIMKFALAIITVPLALIFDVIRNVTLALCCCCRKKTPTVVTNNPLWKQYLLLKDYALKAKNYISTSITKDEKIFASAAIALSVVLRDLRPSLLIGAHIGLNRVVAWVNAH